MTHPTHLHCTACDSYFNRCPACGSKGIADLVPRAELEAERANADELAEALDFVRSRMPTMYAEAGVVEAALAHHRKLREESRG